MQAFTPTMHMTTASCSFKHSRQLSFDKCRPMNSGSLQQNRMLRDSHLRLHGYPTQAEALHPNVPVAQSCTTVSEHP